MNFDRILADEVQDWIVSHTNEDIYKLALKKSPFADIPMRELIQQIQGRKVAEKKFKYLDKHKALFPPKLNLEQTSSSITADYKANLVEGDYIADITGGFGIDSISFAKNFDQVYHVEKNEELQKIASHNFQVLGINHINSFAADGVSFLSYLTHSLDVIYVDPSRRDQQKKKVFLLEDLQPNILEHIDLFFAHAVHILIKLSPLIDIKYLYRTLPHLQEIHVVAVKNEVKEVLIKLSKIIDQSPQVYAVNLDTNQDNFYFSLDQITSERSATSFIKKYIYEPNAAIQKSGGNDILANRYNLYKLHPNTQLYTSDELYKQFPGRIFEVLEDIKNPKKELKNKSILAVHRNYSVKLPELQKKFKFRLDGVEPILFTQNLDQHIMKRMRLVYQSV